MYDINWHWTTSLVELKGHFLFVDNTAEYGFLAYTDNFAIPSNHNRANTELFDYPNNQRVSWNVYFLLAQIYLI